MFVDVSMGAGVYITCDNKSHETMQMRGVCGSMDLCQLLLLFDVYCGLCWMTNLLLLMSLLVLLLCISICFSHSISLFQNTFLHGLNFY